MRLWKKLSLCGFLMVLFVGCGFGPSNSMGSPSTSLSNLEIISHPVDESQAGALNLSDQEQIKQLYQTIQGLPALPADQACTEMAGPRFELTFLDQKETMLNATADKGGCQTVTLGEGDTRLANATFWNLLGTSMAQAALAAEPDKLEMALNLVTDGQPLQKTVTDAEKIQQLLDAALKLKRLPEDQACTLQLGPSYNLSFLKDDQQLVNIVADKSGCGTVTLAQNDTRLADEAFWTLLRDIGGKELDENQGTPPATTNEGITVEITTLPVTEDSSVAMINGEQEKVKLLYEEALASPKQPDDLMCTMIADTRYELTFYQDGQEDQKMTADKGGCRTVTLGDGDVRLASEEFWTLLNELVG